jgi:hypothetical protein
MTKKNLILRRTIAGWLQFKNPEDAIYMDKTGEWDGEEAIITEEERNGKKFTHITIT